MCLHVFYGSPGMSACPLLAFDYIDLETKTLQGTKGENRLSSTGTFLVDNSTVDFQKLPDKEILRMAGPLTADFIIKVSLFVILITSNTQAHGTYNL